MIQRGILLALTMLLTGATPQQGGVVQRVVVHVIGRADCLAHALGVRVWDESLNLPLAPAVAQRTATSFVLTLAPGYYHLFLLSKDCSGDQFVGVLPGRNRLLVVTMECDQIVNGKRKIVGIRMVDGARGLAGTLPDSIQSIRVWPALGGERAIEATISNGAYYFDEINCDNCVLEIESGTGKASRLAVSLLPAQNFTLSRRNLSREEIRTGLSVRDSPFNAPETLVEGPDQSIWALDRLGNRVAEFASGRPPREFDLPTPFSNPGGIVATAHFVWVSELNPGKIVRFGLDGANTEYAVGEARKYNGRLRMTRGGDGRLWFIDIDRLGALDEAGKLAEYPVPAPVAGLSDVALGADGRLWVSGEASNYGLGKPFIAARAASGTWQRFSLSDIAAIIKPGAKGLWITNGIYYENYLAYIDLRGHEGIAKLPVGSMGPTMYAVDAADDLWFSDRYGNVIAHAVPDGSVVAGYANFEPSGISDMQIDRGGNVWIAEPGARVVEEYQKGVALPPRGVRPTHLLFDSSGTLWYSDPAADVVGTIVTHGRSKCYAFRLSHVKNCTFDRADIVGVRTP